MYFHYYNPICGEPARCEMISICLRCGAPQGLPERLSCVLRRFAHCNWLMQRAGAGALNQQKERVFNSSSHWLNEDVNQAAEGSEAGERLVRCFALWRTELRRSSRPDTHTLTHTHKITHCLSYILTRWYIYNLIKFIKKI